jgi:DNA (cytosine-5)-methyltransferase 1
MSGLTAVSLFAGIGGIDLALERCGVNVVAAVEIDKNCRGVLAHRFPQTRLFSDVREVTGDQLIAAGFVPGRGILAAGWPCTGNSVAGRREGLGDPRSGLWRHVVRLLAETRAAWFLGENVPGLLSVNGGADIAVVRRDLAQLGYWWAERILDAQHFGVPQRRARLFFVGCAGDRAAPVEVLLEPEGSGGHPAPGRPAGADVAGTLGSRAGGSRTTDLDGHGAYVVSTLQGGGRRGHRVDAEGAAGGHLITADVAGTLRTHPRPGSADPGAVTVAHAITAREGKGPDSDATSGFIVTHALTAEGADASEDGTGCGTPLVPVFAPLTAGTPAGPGVNAAGRRMEDDWNLAGAGPAVRRLTPRECERLQGFPDDWTRWLADGSEQSDSARYRQLGNAVAVPVVGWIARRLAAVAARDDQQRRGAA